MYSLPLTILNVVDLINETFIGQLSAQWCHEVNVKINQNQRADLWHNLRLIVIKYLFPLTHDHVTNKL